MIIWWAGESVIAVTLQATPPFDLQIFQWTSDFQFLQVSWFNTAKQHFKVVHGVRLATLNYILNVVMQKHCQRVFVNVLSLASKS
jgi:hypothetical protein